MTMPPLPAQGSTNWRGWASALHDAATEVTEGRLTEAELRAAFDPVPDVLGATVDGTTDDSAAFDALMALADHGLVHLDPVTPAGASTPAYVLAETVDVPYTKSLRGDGFMSRIRVPAGGGSFTGGIIFRLNTNASHGWVQPYPGLPATTVSNFVVHALEAGAAGHLLTAFEFGGKHHFSDLYFIGVDQAVEQINEYCDLVTIERVEGWAKPDSANWFIDLPASGDAVEIRQTHIAIDPALDYRPKHIHLRFKQGAAIRGVINGDVLVENSRAVIIESLHMENGQVTLSMSNGRISDGLFYMRNRTNQKVIPVVVSQGAGLTSSAGAVVTLQDLAFAYTTALPGSYPTDNIANVQISGSGATPRSLVQIRNLARVVWTGATYVYYGVTCDADPVFNAYSHLASVESSFRNGVWDISANQPALVASAGIDTGSSGTDSTRTWQGAAGTYYYKLVALMDPKRMIGRVGSAEKSQAVTAGGNAPALVVHVDFRRQVMLRLYRGTASGSYDSYVDVPLISGGRLHDSGVDVGGFPWISRTAGPVDTINTDIDAGLELTPGETTATSDAYGHAVAYARTSTAPPTVGSWRRGDRVLLVSPVVSGASRLLGWVRLTDCTTAVPAHVMGTDWAELRSPTS